MRRGLFTKSLLVVLFAGPLASCSGSTAPGPNEVAAVSIFTLKFTVNAGETLQLQGRAVNYSGVRIDNQVTFTWTSSKPAFATVSNTGLVTGVVSGSTVITASAGGFFHSVTIDVSAPVGGGT